MGVSELNEVLSRQSYVGGWTPSAADGKEFAAMASAPDAGKYPHASRWWAHMNSFSANEIAAFGNQAPKPTTTGKSGKGKGAAAADEAPKRSFERRDNLIKWQEEAQAKWDASKAFDYNPPADKSSPKFFGCFPYPYMNGKMHLGHTFTLSKLEFTIGFQRMLGKQAFFPFAFHCTGMPIQSCANKLKTETATFGLPPTFPEDAADAAAPAAAPAAAKAKAKNVDPTKFKSSKSKATAKTGTETRQWKIMQALGFQDDEIEPFREAKHWLDYFPPIAKEDISLLGCKVDWRRAFITTEANPYYDAFIRWQFWTLKELGKVKFGKRYAVWSPRDAQVCADHDRSSGEGHGPQEYTIVKMEVAAPYPPALQSLAKDGRKVYFAAATLRPETMYGQTNCWIAPDGEYGAYGISKDAIYVLTHRAARNLAFQDQSMEYGKVQELATFTGDQLMGVGLRSPHCKYDVIYTLPMMTIDCDKTTGVVTSVPSDSPDDYMALQDLRNKPALREKFGVKEEWVSFDAVPIIDVKGESNMFAKQVCEEMGIASQNDRAKLEEAHDVVYKKGFYEGTMAVGKYAGRSVEEAKPLIRDDMLRDGLASKYAEPAGKVVSRTNDVCVVALCDQWFLEYGEKQWRSQVGKCLDDMDCYHDEVARQFKGCLDWLKEWACSREFGLGTQLPWDKKWVIESLSDSTIYMAYYTIAHYLQGDMFGTTPGSMNIKPEQMTREVFDCIFLDKPYPTGCGIAEADVAKMRDEFNYWYPVDMRVSGKDLIQNHLTFFMYNHTAMFGEDKWPKGIRCNGHLMLNNAKMSKSTGNFMTMREATLKYSADATRLALADAGDGVDDANYVEDTADKAILRLTTFVETCKMVVETSSAGKYRKGEPTFLDKWFKAKMQEAMQLAKQAYDRSLFREATKYGYYELSTVLGRYQTVLTSMGMEPHADMMLLYIELQTIAICPICPHTAEKVWPILGKKGLAIDARWPELGEPDEQVMAEADYLFGTVKDLRAALTKFKNPKKGPKGLKPAKITLYVAAEFPAWQKQMLGILAGLFDTLGRAPEKQEYIKAITSVPELKKMMKMVMGVAAYSVDLCVEKGNTNALSTEVPFDEAKVLAANMAYVAKEVEGVPLDIVTVTPDVVAKLTDKGHKSTAGAALPMKPGVVMQKS